MGNKSSSRSTSAAARTPPYQQIQQQQSIQQQLAAQQSVQQQRPPAAPAQPSSQQQQQQPPVQQQQSAPPLQRSAATNPVRCPRCRRLLEPPAGHERFLCPCGQMLMSPPSAQQRQAAVTHVRCPTCNTTLVPPPNAPIFRCPCGTHLRAATSVLQSMGRSQARLDGGAEGSAAASSGGSGSALLSGASQQQIVATLAHMRGEQQWLRKVAPDGRSLMWVNLQSDDEERRKLELESQCIKELRTNVDKLETKGLYEKLEAMGISTEKCDDKDDLRQLLKQAPELLAKVSVKDLKARLEALSVSFEGIIEKEELVNRLITASWFNGLYDDGYVRSIRKDFSLEWVPAYKQRLDCQDSPRPQSAQALEHMSAQPFMVKLKWFRERLGEMKLKWEDGRVQMKVRRSELLRDSFSNLNKLSPVDMHRFWRFGFVGEEGIDAGGLAREWFQLVTDQCFNVDFGLFEYSGVDNICYQINPSSGIANELHLKYFYFLGRVMGKAIFDGHNISGHMARPLYKHLLGFPITQDDIEFVDVQVHRSMQDIRNCDDASELYLDFTTAARVFGETQTVELLPGGADLEVDNQNRETYLHLLVKYMLFDRIAEQLAMLLRGFTEVVPANLLCVFDHHELELLMCGLPNINVDDWRNNSQYRGVYAQGAKTHQCVLWFWELMNEFDDEQRARFLQFATGTSRVPVQGFGALQGNDGNIKLFTIDSIPLKNSVFPRAHTCFNRIDLPIYESKAQMKKFILQALQLEAVGFNQE